MNRLRTAARCFSIACLSIVAFYYFVFHIYPYMNFPWGYTHTIKTYIETYDEMVTIANSLDRMHDKDQISSASLQILRATHDPFTGNEFMFLIDDKPSARWYLISTGPDRKFEYSENPFDFIPYDPTNGTESKGDVVFGSHLNPKYKGTNNISGRVKGNPDEYPDSWQKSYGGFKYVEENGNGI